MKFNEITKNIYSNYSLNDIKNRMRLLGIEDEKEVLKFLNIRLFTSIIIFFMILYFLNWGYILSPIIVVLYYIFLPNIVIDSKIKKRKAKLENEAMYFFEVLSLSLESGNNLYNAIKVTSEIIDSEISDEFKRMIIDMEYSKGFDEAINDMKSRIPSDTINNILLNIRESNMFGNSILGTLNNQINYLRDTKILETRAYISKIPLKISVISVVFFIPLLLLLILGPVLINYIG